MVDRTINKPEQYVHNFEQFGDNKCVCMESLCTRIIQKQTNHNEQ